MRNKIDQAVPSILQFSDHQVLKEVVEKEVNNLQSDNLLLKVQITNNDELRESMELSYKEQISSLMAKLQKYEK